MKLISNGCGTTVTKLKPRTQHPNNSYINPINIKVIPNIILLF